jgi:hypothetical protein
VEKQSHLELIHGLIKKIVLDKHEIEEVHKFPYLGRMMTSTGGIKDEVKHGFKRQTQHLFICIQCGELERYPSRQG